MSAQFPKCCYSIDRLDHIKSVDEQWLAFARENGASNLRREYVVGRSLWDFVKGAEVRRLYEAIFQDVRDGQGIAIVPFRCDSPNLRREMRLTMTSGDNAMINLQGVLCQARLTRFIPLFDQNARRSDQQLTLCSVCKRALLEPMGWMQVAEVASRMSLFDKELQPEIVHSVCPNCALNAPLSLN